MQDQVLAAARKIVDARPPSHQGGRVVSLSELRADPDVQRHVNTESRITDIMNQLADGQMVRMVSRHPEQRWYVSAEGMTANYGTAP